MEAITNVWKGSYQRLKRSLGRLREQQTAPPGPPAPAEEAEPNLDDQTLEVVDHQQQLQFPMAEPVVVPAAVVEQEPQRNAQVNLDWRMLTLGFCLSSSADIAVQLVQTQHHLPISFHLLGFSMVLAFLSIFVSSYIASKNPRRARFLEHTGAFFATTAFIFAITLSFPLCLKLISWALYGLCLLAIVFCQRY